MSSELSGNPYVVGPPVTGESLYGRQEIFQFIEESLAGLANRVIVLHGQRRVGKSSVLQELHLHRLPSEKYCAVRIDAQGQVQTPFSTFSHDLATHISEALNMAEPILADFEENVNYLAQRFLPAVLAALGNRRLVIMVDEFDGLATDENSASTPDTASTGARFLPTLQTILDDNKFSQIVFIFVIGSSLEKLPRAFGEFIRGARFSRIWLLSRFDTETLITKPATGMLTYEKQALDRIWHYTSGHPYFTQLLCYELFNRAKRRQQPLVKANDVDQIIGAALERGRPAFVWLWDALSVAERLLVSAIGSIAVETGVARKEEIQNILNKNRIRLGNVDLVKAANHLVGEHVLRFEGDDGYRFEVELVRQWVKQNHNLNQEKLKISEMSRSAVSYYNVARRSHDRGRLEAAIEGYHLALQDNPNHFNAQLGLAQALRVQGNLVEAVDEFEEAYWLNEEVSLPGLLEARLVLAESLAEKGEDIEAAVHYRRVHELAPDHRPLQEKLRIFYDKGERARNRGIWTEAAEFLERVVDIDPNYKDARPQLLEILYSQGREAEDAGDRIKAAQFFGRVVDIDPTYQDAAQRRDALAAPASKEVQAGPTPSRPRSWMPIIGAVIVVLILLGGIGGWLIWGGGFVQATPTPTQAIAVVDGTPATEPTSEPTEELTQEATVETTEEPTQEPTMEPTEEPTQEPTTEPTIEPTEEPTQEPTVEPTIEPTEESTEEPTIEPTAEPTQELTTEPTEEPTQEPTIEPTAEPRPLPAGEALDVDIKPQTQGEALFALLKNGSIYRTQDGGNAWEEVRPADSSGLTILAVAPANSEVIYAGGFGQILKSTDGGDAWRAIFLPGPVQVHDLAITNSDPNIVYAATSSGILISQDGGESWINAKESNGQILQTLFYAVTLTADSDHPVYAAGEGDVIYRADDAAANWQSLVCQGCNISDFYALAARGNTVYAGGTSAILVRSNNGGFDWQLANNGIPDPSVPTLDIAGIILAPDGNTIYIGTGFKATNANGRGIFRSTNSGGSWERLPLPSGAGNTYYVQSVALDPANSDVIYIAGFGGVHKSEDGGQNWVRQ